MKYKDKKNDSSYKYRFWFLVFLLVLICGGLVWRMLDLNIFDRSFLLSQGDARTIRVVSIPAYRGMITDRKGEPLAISTEVQSVWMNPKKFSASPEQIKRLSAALDIPESKIEKMAKNKSREFAYLKRRLNPDVIDKIKLINIDGINFQKEYKRFYPEGEADAHVIGMTNIDDKGIAGIELAYNNWLEGIPGKKRVVVDRYGNIINELGILQTPRPGHDLTLSIDRRIQYLAFSSLKAAVERFDAKSGSIVVLDPQTGQILAMANMPSFNPNKPTTDTGQFRNRALTDIFEPGSTAKTFSMVSALSSGKYTKDSMVDTSPGWYYIGKHEVQDIRNYGKISVTEILKKSSNVGISRVTLSLPPEDLLNTLHNVGFGSVTDTGFPGETSGVIPYKRKWTGFPLTVLSFGYNFSTTLLQLARAYSVIANGGIMRPTTFIKDKKTPEGKRVIQPQVAQDVRTMLKSVVEPGGTAPQARVHGYNVAGKTGTVRMVGPNGYEKDHHIGMFVGMIPASDPKLVIAVELTDPRKENYYGGFVAAPVFAKVAAGALRMMHVPPDITVAQK